MKRMLHPLVHPTVFYIMTKSYREEKLLCKQINEMVDKILNLLREKEADNNNIEGNFYDLLSREKHEFSEEEIRDHIKAIIYGVNICSKLEIFTIHTFQQGYDTSSSTIAAVLLMLAMHKEVQDKAVMELRKILGSTENIANLNITNDLFYLEMIIKEAMRLFPVGSLVCRQTSGTVSLGKLNNFHKRLLQIF